MNKKRNPFKTTNLKTLIIFWEMEYNHDVTKCTPWLSRTGLKTTYFMIKFVLLSQPVMKKINHKASYC